MLRFRNLLFITHERKISTLCFFFRVEILTLLWFVGFLIKKGIIIRALQSIDSWICRSHGVMYFASFDPTLLTPCRISFFIAIQCNSNLSVEFTPDCVKATVSSWVTLTISSTRMIGVYLTRPSLFLVFFYHFFFTFFVITKAQGGHRVIIREQEYPGQEQLPCCFLNFSFWRMGEKQGGWWWVVVVALVVVV